MVGFLKGLFSKKACENCGKEVGVMSRNKIRSKDGSSDKEYICNECKRDVSPFFVDYYHCDIDGIKEHIEYMKHQEELFQKIFLKSKYLDYRNDRLGVYFADELGMFHIKNPKYENYKNNHDIFRYDQIGEYEVYVDYEKSIDGKSEVLKEMGVVIYMNSEGGQNVFSDNSVPVQGQISHPYVSEVRIVTATKGDDETNGEYLANNIIGHINYLFGIETGGPALFKIGLSKGEKRNLQAGVSAVKGLAGLARGAMKGDMESEKDVINEMMDAANDRLTQGRSTYGKLADEAIARLHDMEN